MNLYKSGVKRILEFSLSLTGLIIASPVFIIVTILMSIANNGKPFFFSTPAGQEWAHIQHCKVQNYERQT